MSYRAIRAESGLPNRGQRTRSNARTAKALKGSWGQSSFAKKQKKISLKNIKKKFTKNKEKFDEKDIIRKYSKRKKSVLKEIKRNEKLSSIFK